MPFPPEILRAARVAAGGEKDLRHHFVSPDTAVVVGYITGAGPHEPEAIRSEAINPLLGGQSCVVRLVQDTDDPDLYWIVVRQSFGTFLYTWQSGGQTHHQLLMASDSELHATDMARAAEAAARHHVALRLHVYCGREFALLMQVARVVTTYEHGVLAIRLATWLLEQEGQNLDAAADRAERVALMKNGPRIRNLSEFNPVVTLRRGDALSRISRAASIILANARK